MSSGRYLRMVARIAPAAVALAILPALLAGIGSGCGKGIFSEVTSSGSPSPTATTGVGAFLYASNFKDGKIVGFKRNRTTGALATISPTTTAGSGGVSGMTITPDNRFLYAADSGSNNVYEFRINSNGSLSRIGGGSIAAGTQPLTIAVDSTISWAFAANQGGGGSVTQYSINSSNGTLTANGSVTGFSGQPFGIVAHPIAGFVYISDNQTGIIYTFQIQNDGTLKKIATNNSLGNQPGHPGLMTIVADISGNFYLYVPDTNIGVVSQFTIQANGTLLFGATSGTPSGDKPLGIAPANNAAGTTNNYLFTAEQTGNYVQYFLRSGAQITSQGALNGLNAPTGLVVDPKAQFAYAAEFSTATVAQLSILGSCGQILCFVNRFNTESGSGGETEFLAITN